MSFAAESPPPSTEEVVAAIQTLYHGQDPKAKEAASRWLHDLQRSVHAWKAADSLLHAKASLESCYFAAQGRVQQSHICLKLNFIVAIHRN